MYFLVINDIKKALSGKSPGQVQSINLFVTKASNDLTSIVSSIIQTLLSAPEYHRFSPACTGVAGFNRRSGILVKYQSPCPEETFKSCRQK